MILDRYSDLQVISEIPVYFRIPDGAMTRDFNLMGGIISWRLDIKAKAAGINYNASFQLPVFKARFQMGISSCHQGTFRSTQAVQRQPKDQRIHMSPLAGGGCECEIPAMRNPAAAVFLILFGGIFAGIGYALGVFGELVFGIIFSLIGFAILFWPCARFLESVTITVHRGLLTIERRFPLWHRQLQFQASDITDFNITSWRLLR